MYEQNPRTENNKQKTGTRKQKKNMRTRTKAATRYGQQEQRKEN